MANAYRLAARWADEALKGVYKQKFEEACEQALAMNDQDPFALLERGFSLIDDDPEKAASFFEQQFRDGKHAHILGFHVGSLLAQDRNGDPVTDEQWQAVLRRFPTKRMLITIEHACQVLEHANGNTQSVLQALRQQLHADPETLPVTLRENHKWLQSTVEQRLFEHIDPEEPLEAGTLSLVLDNYRRNKRIVQGVAEQSLAIY